MNNFFGGFALLFCMVVLAPAPTTFAQDNVFAQIQASHIEGNVPDAKVFDAYLRRDLAKYLKAETGKVLSVRYEPLRIGPTQSGVSFPKYYLWVTALAKGKVITQGAVRVAAIDKKYFEVTDYLTVADLQKSPEKINATFPVLVGDKIRERLKTLRVRSSPAPN